MRFPSAIVTDSVENNTVEVEVFEPRDARRPMPLVILLHYFGATDLGVERRFARNLNARGFAAAILTLPYHLQRTPPGKISGEYALRPDAGFLRETMTQAVFDVKRFLDWVEQRPLQFDLSRIGIAGISLGAVVGSLALAVEPRITAGAFLLGGVDVAHLIWHSSATINARNVFRGQGYTEQRLRDELASVEPTTYPRREIGERVIVVGARFDEVVPRASTLKLIEMFDAKTEVWLESGHYGGAIAERRLYRTVAEFLQAKFLGEAFDGSPGVQVPTIRVGVHYNTDYKLTVAVGLDIWRAPRNGGFVSAILTPEGPAAFGGVSISRGLALGATITPKRATWGAFWSVVL